MTLNISSDRIAEFCRRHRIKRLAVFGSAIREDVRPKSDVDVLYEFEEGYSPGWNIVKINKELSEIFGGRDVDMVALRYLNRHMRDRVLKEARVYYDAA